MFLMIKLRQENIVEDKITSIIGCAVIVSRVLQSSLKAGELRLLHLLTTIFNPVKQMRCLHILCEKLLRKTLQLPYMDSCQKKALKPMSKQS